MSDTWGRTALSEATWKAYKDVVKILLESGAERKGVLPGHFRRHLKLYEEIMAESNRTECGSDQMAMSTKGVSSGGQQHLKVMLGRFYK